MSGIVTGMKAEYMIADQRFVSRRPDVLVYQTGELDEDVTLVGGIEVDLVVSTSGTDSDWVVKLIDVSEYSTGPRLVSTTLVSICKALLCGVTTATRTHRIDKCHI